MRRMVGFSTCRQVLIGPNLATVCKSRACSQQLPHDTMVSPSTMLKLIKGSSPDFRSRQGRLAFAVHAWYLAAGYKLVAVGATEVGRADCSQEAPEVEVDGWDQDQDSFSFAYAHHLRGQKGVRVKMTTRGNNLRVAASDPSATQAPSMLEIPVDRFVDEQPGNAQGYTDMAGLAQLLTAGLTQPDKAASSGPPTQAEPTPATASQGTGRSSRPSRLEEPEPEFRGRGPPEGNYPSSYQPQQPQPLPLGAADVVPPGFRPPGMPSGSFPGLMESPRRGGGMHMGFDDPAFGGRGPSGGSFRGGGGMGGAWWDPIAPPGMQGFRPEDFQRGGRQGRSFNPDVHPDLMQPGPRNDSHFDDMFS